MKVEPSADNPLGVNHKVGLDETGGPTEPWLVRGAITMMDKYLESCKPRPIVFEFGCGSSTPWFVDRADRVFSVEHIPWWGSRVADYLNSTSRKHCVMLCPINTPNYVDAARFVSSTVLDKRGKFRGFDLILVDIGPRAFRCVERSYELLRDGGMFVIDNTERGDYAPAIKLLDGLGWERHNFENSLWKTTVWLKPARGAGK